MRLTSVGRIAAAFGVLVVVAMIVTAAGRVTGGFVQYNLYTHCGVTYADFDGKRFYADPPLNDGNGNPPRGWANPSDGGFMILRDADTAVFVDGSGHRADFSTHPRSGVPTIRICS
jgi:hypothetical protein